MSTIESNNYIATDHDIGRLALTILEGNLQADRARGTYLRALVATTQSELHIEPRQRNGKPARVSPDVTAETMAAFQGVAARFYDAVMTIARSTTPAPENEEVRRRTAFARSASSTVRGWIRAGNDIKQIAACRATKAGLATPLTHRPMTLLAMRRKADKLADALTQIAEALNDANHDMALEVLQPIIARLVDASGMATEAISNSAKAICDSVPFKTGTDMYVPIHLATFRARPPTDLGLLN